MPIHNFFIIVSIKFTSVINTDYNITFSNNGFYTFTSSSNTEMWVLRTTERERKHNSTSLGWKYKSVVTKLFTLRRVKSYYWLLCGLIPGQLTNICVFIYYLFMYLFIYLFIYLMYSLHSKIYTLYQVTSFCPLARPSCDLYDDIIQVRWWPG